MQLKEDLDKLEAADTQVLVVATLSVPRLTRHLESNGLSFAGVADLQGSVFAAYQVREGDTPSTQRPAVYILDKSGVVRYAHLGQQLDGPSSEEVQSALSRLNA